MKPSATTDNIRPRTCCTAVMTQRRDALVEYLRGALWTLPGLAAVAALVVGAGLSQIRISDRSRFRWLVFQGTADDARTLLIGIAGTMITVIALVLGLTVVALQLSSTQYSPRLLRNYLRDRPNQIVLSIFVAAFAYSTAGLYTVGVSAGARTTDFPRLAVAGALVLAFLSLGALVFAVHHLARSMQIDQIMRVVERNTLSAIGDARSEHPGDLPDVPPWAAAVPAAHTGYIQVVRARPLLEAAESMSLTIRLQPRRRAHRSRNADRVGLAIGCRPAPGGNRGCNRRN